MHTQQFQHPAASGAVINSYCWLPQAKPKRVLQIVHGMAEHAGRYAAFAETLTQAGYAVYAQDLRGHGPGAELLGHFGAGDGWQRLIAEVADIHAFIRDQHPQLPVILFGHSMGSFIAQECAARFGGQLAALVLSATDMPPQPLRLAGQLAAKIEHWRLGARSSSALLQQLSFGNFNRPFASETAAACTGFEWLSSDPLEVDKYIADPYCGFACTTDSWWQLLHAIGQLQSRSSLQAIPADLPIMMIAGDSDPVARNGKGPYALAAKYRRAQLNDVSTKIYAGGRHELLNDHTRGQVMNDLLAWLDRRLNTTNI